MKRELMRITEKVDNLLQEKGNLERWRKDFNGYLEKLTSSENHLDAGGHTTATRMPLRLYTRVSDGSWSAKGITLDARLYGVSVATVTSKGAAQDWVIKQGALSNQIDRILEMNGSNKRDVLDKRNLLYSLCEKNQPLSPQAEVALDALLACLPKGADYVREGGKSEAALESALLENFSLQAGEDKWLRHIQPIGVVSGQRRTIIPLQFPSPINASELHKKDYNAEELHFRTDSRRSGHIDILARTGAGRHRGTKLAVLELKSADEDVRGAIRQAVAYAVFIRALLRSNEQEKAVRWWRFFGFGDKHVPKVLAIQAVAALPMPTNGEPVTEDLVHTLQLGNDSITTHYLYVDMKNERSITSLPPRG